jgi:hypothetical protein
MPIESNVASLNFEDKDESRNGSSSCSGTTNTNSARTCSECSSGTDEDLSVIEQKPQEDQAQSAIGSTRSL